MSETENPESEEQSQRIEFLQIASIFFNQGAMALGAIPNPMTGQVYVSFEAVKDSIEILEVLQLKTRGNLEPDEERAIASMIDELKLAFVQAIRDPEVRALAERSRQQSAAPAKTESSRILTPDGRPASSGEAGPKIILPGSL